MENKRIKEDAAQKLTPFLWQCVKPFWILFALLGISCLAWAIDHTLMPYIFKIFLDKIISFTGNRSEIWVVIASPIAYGVTLWITIEIMYRASNYISAALYPRFEASVRMHTFEYVQKHSFSYFSEHFAGDIASKIESLPEGLTQIMDLVLSVFIPSLVAFAIGVLIFISVHPIFAIIIVGWAILHLGFCLLVSERCNKASNMHSKAKNKLNGVIVDSLTNTILVKAFARVPWEHNYIGRYQQKEQKKHHDMLYLNANIRTALGILSFVVIGVIMTLFQIKQWQQGNITANELVYIFYTCWGLVSMTWYSGSELPNLFKEIGKCRQSLSLIRVPHEIIDQPEAKLLYVSEGKIVFDNVTFGYEGQAPIFKNKTVIIEPGQKVGLVGYSGSGKTTFTNLLLRFFDLKSGRILIDGQDIHQVTQDSLREHISLIPQDISLFHRTLKDNIRYGRLSATDDEIIEVAKRAHCHDFITKLPLGYETLAGERGVKLSGGQRQRIAIARALLKDAPILILDEATSALDSVTEQELQEDLYHLMEQRTTIVIAHRLSTLSKMDRILVFNQGVLIEDGRHEDLIYANGHYAKMWAMQAGGFLPDEHTDTSHNTQTAMYDKEINVLQTLKDKQLH
ncbi:MAG: putative transporter ATP-binding protein [Chlamydiales bacterium]|jgi:ATP-binding cassette subfamily B protein|nr:putative transporter ATP-binding protein [Chlamydiales bacterium]